ncbi:ribonuclease Y [Candidatus Nomurabacteria bacterium]|uniref:Ribonuclease Y n=1 Tax=Candidatus Dojkabacteria bacterium TaxID=2099670 RepID=A0A955KXZ3_9BACT|nr:ribonuclease Y [Candidatus Dojkabacteria bacterium]MCB9789387.1 ribonuclease Y [Candidatus Nomurabacteria bacterium]MCB9803709.1 ribonuclease Y [Candidatus Nomurabacteria bacterium]
MEPVTLLVTVLISLSVGAVGAYNYGMKKGRPTKAEDYTEEEVRTIVQKRASEKMEQAEREALEIRERAEERAKTVRKELVEQENLLMEREKTLNQRSKMIEQEATTLEEEKIKYKRMKQIVEDERSKLKKELEKISGLTREEAKQKLLKEVEEDIKNYEASLIRAAEKRSEEVAEERSKQILIESMQRIVTDYVGETTTSTIKLEDEKVKGRVIGKDGRNIRAFEKITGVDVIVDESPNAIGLSSFDPLRREIAKVAMDKLIKDGRIHPGTIEEEVRKAKNEIATEIKKNGQILADEAGWPGMDLGLLKLIGKMKYRTSYGQSLMKHTIEVVRLGAALASELNADVDLVKKACLLHDVGKVLTHKVEGAHHHISGQIARKYGLPDKLVNAIEAHHLDIEPQSIEAMVVYLADAISGARPGARKDSYEQYIKRVEGIENVAKDLAKDKIDDVYAIHAGREVRVIVKPKSYDDAEAAVLAKDIAAKIQETQTYPGTVQVTVIREYRVQETAM